MIDTIKLSLGQAWLRPAPQGTWPQAVYPHPGVVSARNGRVYGVGTRRRLEDPATGLRVYGDEEAGVSVECSLPRQVASSNGHVIASQAEVDGALAAMFERLSEVADVEEEALRVTRLDLVQHLAIDPADMVTAYRDFRYPGIHEIPMVRAGESIWWSGMGLKVLIYDKRAEQGAGSGKVTRLEFRLSGKVLRREFGGEVNTLDFDQCYGVYRRLAQRLLPKRLPRLSKVADLLAYVEHEGVKAMDYWLRGKSAPTVRTIRREVTSARLQYAEINVMDHLPVHRPPAPIHIHGTGCEVDASTDAICT